jgi:hypothetical protein
MATMRWGTLKPARAAPLAAEGAIVPVRAVQDDDQGDHYGANREDEPASPQ